MPSSLVWAVVVVWVAWRVERLAERVLDVRHKSTQALDPKPQAIPDDLEAFALMESELHAQNAVRAVILERYKDLQDWNLVRRAVGVGVV